MGSRSYFRERTLAASLKQYHVADPLKGSLYFRERTLAASLKLNAEAQVLAILRISASARSRPH